MKRNSFCLAALLAVFCLSIISFAAVRDAAAAGTDGDFEKYRQAIKKDHGIDIRNYRDSMKGGRADGKRITKYDLNQLLMGIREEQEHTRNKMKALEIAMDHLEKIPDYYTRLAKMEEEAANYMKINR